MGAPAEADQGKVLLDLYDRALPEVYGYLVGRCGSVSVAEDLTGEVFLAAVSAVQRDTVDEMSMAWLVGVARNKLVDHWRRKEREERSLAVVHDDPVVDDDWDDELELTASHAVLAGLGGHHRSALTLRYLDGLSVPEVAHHLGRTVHATEALLVRARLAFRKAYRGEE